LVILFFDFKTMITKRIVFVLLITMLYSIIRYNIFGNVSWSDIPTFVFNKSISFSMIIILALATFSLNRGSIDEFTDYMKVIKLFSIVHVLISINLLSLEYYPKLMENNKLSLSGNWALLFGVLTFAVLFNTFKINNLILYLLLAFHVFFIGFKSWLNIEKWNGYMPPITLICFLLIIFVIIKLRIKQ